MMELLTVIVDFFLHLDIHLHALAAAYDQWLYVLIFLIIFSETGFVVTPFLPGDSLLFAAGALAAVGGLEIKWLLPLLFLASALFFLLQIGLQISYRPLHHPGTFHDLWEEHLTRSKQVANCIHSIHKRAFDHLKGRIILDPCFLSIFFDMIHDTPDECMIQPVFNLGIPPFFMYFFGGIICFNLLGKCYQALCCIFSPIQDHILHQGQQIARDLIIYL